nr:Gfo/Idh/MocA family oxidoreductase [Devosia ureilytica]
MRVGLLGTGGIGARHADAVLAVPELELVACCGRDAARTGTFTAPRKAVSYTDLLLMLARERLDLLIVALPPFAHDGQVEQAARAGVHLLVEKPIALAQAKADAMVVATADVVAACGFMYRFGSAVERWDQLRDGGATGRIAHFSGSFHCNALHAQWWRDRALSGGQMVEQLIHIVDLARHNLGMPRSVFASAGRFGHADVPGYTSEDISALILTYDNGAIAVLHASNLAVPGRWTKQWQIIGEAMVGQFSDWNRAEFTSTATDGTTEHISADTDPFVAQLQDVGAAIRMGRKPRVPLKDGADTLRIVLAAQRSADEKREIFL